MSRYLDEFGEPLSRSDLAFEEHGDPMGGYRYPKDRCAMGGLRRAGDNLCARPDCPDCRPQATRAAA